MKQALLQAGHLITNTTYIDIPHVRTFVYDSLTRNLDAQVEWIGRGMLAPSVHSIKEVVRQQLHIQTRAP